VSADLEVFSIGAPAATAVPHGTSEARRQIPAPPAGIAQPSPRPATFDLTKPEDMAARLSEAAPRYPEVWPFDGPLA
jgi:hypothetical protein